LIEEVGLLSAEVRDLQKERGEPKGPPYKSPRDSHVADVSPRDSHVDDV
jgi:hypothetical protein